MNKIIICFIGAVLSHMHIEYPPAEGSAKNFGNGIQLNYDINSPVKSYRYNNPCRYEARGFSVAKVTAGQDLTVQMGGSAPHGGGHCQFGFSYDRKNFAITHFVTETCPLDKEYIVPVPKNAPNGIVTFIWGWNNKIGDREMYINCAEIDIVGGQDSGSIDGKELLLSNIKGAPNSKMFPAEGFNKAFGDEKLNAQKPISVSPTGSRPNQRRPRSVNNKPRDNEHYQKKPEVETYMDESSRQGNQYYNSDSGKSEYKTPNSHDKDHNVNSGRNLNNRPDYREQKNIPWKEENNKIHGKRVENNNEIYGKKYEDKSDSKSPRSWSSSPYDQPGNNRTPSPRVEENNSSYNSRAGLNFVKPDPKKKCKEVGCTGWNLMWNPLNNNYDFYTY